MKLKLKLVFFFLLSLIFHLQSPAQTTENITKAEAETFVQDLLWFLNYDWKQFQKPNQEILNFFSDSLRTALQKDERLSINRQGWVGTEVGALDLPWVELYASTDYDDIRWNKKWKLLLKKENGRLCLVPSIQKTWQNTTVYLWTEEKDISPQERTAKQIQKQKEEVLAYLKKQYANTNEKQYQQKDFYGKWRIDSSFSYYGENVYAYAGEIKFDFQDNKTYTKTWKPDYSYANETKYVELQSHTNWWMIWRDKMIRADVNGVIISTIESKDEHQFELIQRSKEGKMISRQRFTNLPKKKPVLIPIEYPEIEVILQPKYDDIKTFYQGKAFVQLDGKCGSIDTTGAVLIPTVFDHLVITYGESLYAFKDGKQVEINAYGEIVGESKYKSFLTNYTNDRIVVEDWDGKMALLDTFGNQILSTPYDRIEFYTNRIYKVQQEEKWGLLMERGDTILPIEYDSFWEIDPYLFAVQKDKKWGIWNVLANEYSTPPQYERFDLSDEYIVAVSDGKLNLLDSKTFESVEIPEYDLMEYRGGNHFGVEENGKRGIVNIENEIVLPIEYDDFQIYGFDRGGIVKNDGLKGLVDQKGKEILPIQYEYLQLAYDDDFAMIGTEGQKGIINLKGDTLISVAYEELSLPYDPYEGAGEEWICFKKEGKYGYMNLEEKVLIPAEYDQRLYFYDKISMAEKNGKFGIINTKNEVVLNFLFDEILMTRESPILIVKYKGYYGLVRNPAAN